MAEEKIKSEEKKNEDVLEEEKLAVLAPIMKSIQIALDSYDDLFSDFDNSPYSTRVLSDDFLKEIKKRYYENKKGDFELNFTLPAAKRNAKVESIIKKRLRDYFKAEMSYFNEKIDRIKTDGLHRLVVGFILLSIEVVLPIFDLSENLYAKILSVFIIPAGWYGFYSGFEHIFEYARDFESSLAFHEKIAKIKYEFISEESLLTGAGEVEQKALEQK